MLHPRRVLVAGGGIAGMKAAHTAALRGHDVTLCEAGGRLGGILNTEEALPFKHDMYELARTYERLCQRAGVHIIMNQPVDAAFCEVFRPDALIVAVGSEELRLPIPVEEGAWVVGIDELYLEAADPGSEVVVIGGGLTGCECALLMAQQGRVAHLVEMGPELAPDANIRNRPILLEQLEAAGVDIHVGTRALAVCAGGVRVADADGAEQVLGGTAICAIGRRSRSAIVDDLRDGAPFVRIIGDAQRPANICLAIYEAYHAALDI